MIKAYINGSTITVKKGKKEVSYPVGAGAVSLCSKWDFTNPYEFFDDFNASDLKAFAKSELAKLISIEQFDLETLAEFDNNRKNKLYTAKNFVVSIEFLESALPCFELSYAKDLFSLEILTAAALKKPIKICENCGEYFIPSGRTDSVYCDRITENGYSCKKVGAHRQYRRNSNLNQLKKLYDKVTKHNRYLKSKGALSAYEYNNWMKEASQKYKHFKEDEISAKEFEAWLTGKEYTPAPRQRNRSSISDYLL